MIQTGFDARVKVQQIIENQLPEFILDESPKAAEFLKQYYISQEFQSGPLDIAENLDQYLKLDNLIPEVVVGVTSLTSAISPTSGIITVTTTKGYPDQYGLLKIDNEVITYTGKTSTTFTGCIRGFSGITSYHSSTNQEDLVFTQSSAESHASGSLVQNLSSLFLKEFYKKLKYTFTPGFEDYDFVPELNAGNFIKQARNFYQSKGTEESFRILFGVLYGVKPRVIDLEQFLIKPSASEFVRRQIVLAERISGDPNKLSGQTIRKSTDYNTNASISEVEILTRKGKTYYKLALYVGFDESSQIQGTFGITPKTKVLEKVSPGGTVITVDSTIGFPDSGTLITGNNVVSYTNKSVNQFLGCSNIENEINIADDIRFDEVYYGYEDNDLTKKVEIRITGVLNNFTSLNDFGYTTEGENISVSPLGKVIKNPESNKTYKELFANSWIYNTSTRYYVTYSSGSFKTKSSIDKSSLKVGDQIQVLIRGSQQVVSSSLTNAVITSISNDTINVTGLLDLNGSTFDPTNPSKIYYNRDLDIRRVLRKSTSTGAPLVYGNNTLLSDIQNVYDDCNGNMYVASNGLPSYTISKNVFEISIPTASTTYIQNKNTITQLYSEISFDFSSGSENYQKGFTSVPFFTGDKIYYKPQNISIDGLSEGYYYVEVIATNKIRLYSSRSFIENQSYVEFNIPFGSTGSHKFTLASQRSQNISPQKNLKKFPIDQGNSETVGSDTIPGSLGMLINGVEIENYKSTDKVYYGPLKDISIVNGGTGYDVINPPRISVNGGAGTTSLINPVVSGSVQSVLVDPQYFDVDVVVSIAMTGGNGSGAVFDPVIEKRRRSIYFDARETTNSGGIDVVNETITFTDPHNLRDGEGVIYYSNGNSPIGISTYGFLNTDSGRYLANSSVYYAKIVNNKTIQLYPTPLDLISGINTVGFTTINTTGTHKFETEQRKNTIVDIKVVNGGSGYTNRRLPIATSGISTFNHTFNFSNHGFKTGETVSYTFQTSAISGLSSSLQYKIIKLDDDTFRVANAGIGGTDSYDYNRNNYVKFTTTGSGYQYFYYPDINLNVRYSVGINSVSVGVVTAVPVVRGSIIDAYLYEKGTNYGSVVLNNHKKPVLKIQNGIGAELDPIIYNGSIKTVQIKYGGLEYYSAPDLKVIGDGSGAVLRPVIQNGKIVRVVVINGGVNYTNDNTYISVVSAGKNALLDCNVRDLTVNNYNRYGSDVLSGNEDEDLKYSVIGYSDNLRSSFGDSSNITNQHSPLIGWAYDGNPIYGGYGYSDPVGTSSSATTIRLLTSGYSLNTGSVINRPGGFNAGFFVEDYLYDNSGDLDESNGRFCKTPEFPLGTYAYFAGITTSASQLAPIFPYFIGNTYKNKFIDENNTIDQSYDFNNSGLIRNTFPYKLNDEYADNDFIIESAEIINQKIIVESTTKGFVDGFTIVSPGDGYKVGDSLVIDNQGTSGSGLDAKVSGIVGKNIVDVLTTTDTYNNSIITRDAANRVKVTILPYHNIVTGDYVTISGLSSSLNYLNGKRSVGVTSYTTTLSKDIPTNAVAGFVTDIYVANIPSSISIGSSIQIDSEYLSILNIFDRNNVLRVERGISGTSYSASTIVNYLPDNFTFTANTDFINSISNQKIFFNPTESVGLGTLVGVGTTVTYVFAGSSNVRSIPTQSVYIESHPFTNNQQVILKKPVGVAATALGVSTSPTGTTFFLPGPGDSQVVYVTNKSRNTIGIKTQINSDELYFRVQATNNYKYSIESVYPQITSKVLKTNTRVSVSTDHQLLNGDSIKLIVEPKLSVGIGTSTSVYVRFDRARQKLLFNPIGFTSVGINTLNNTINLPTHNLKTGDKVFYSSTDRNGAAAGLTTTGYYVYKVDNDTIQLASTYEDCFSVPPIIVGIANSLGIGTGSRNQQIALINPKLEVIKGNNLVFNLSDTSLSGYKLRIYTDNEFKNEFVSVGNTSSFLVSGIGSVGVSTNASLTLTYSPNLPQNLYYALERGGFISTADTDVANYSQISFVDSLYNNSYTVSGVGSTTFNINLPNSPERSSYIQSECSTLKYTTKSNNANGGIDKIKIISGGTNYKKIPTVTSIDSESGKNSYIYPNSSTIGKISEVKILNEGFEYSSDKTLRPTTDLPVYYTESSNQISSVDVLYGGNNFVYAPTLVIYDPISNKEITDFLLEPVISTNTITSVNVIKTPYGLPSTPVKVYTKNNSNGVSVNTVQSSQSGIVTCILTTPILGFSTNVFYVGQRIFVEGIQKDGATGSGFNSNDYGYQTFVVTNYQNTIPAQVEFNLSSLTTNPGVAKTNQDSLASIINYENYPQFSVNLETSKFLVGEKISSNTGFGFVERDLYVTEYDEYSVKFGANGSYKLSVGEIIKGINSGSVATINRVVSREGRFEVDFSTNTNYSWKNNIGKLSDDTQSISDNDYYQNLSYTIKSPIQYDELITPVNSLVHTSGLKNFSDTEVISSARSGIGSTDGSTVVVDIINENRVDTINNFDFAIDINAVSNRSKTLKLKNKKLSSYIECRTNRVLQVDDISGQFTNNDTPAVGYADLLSYNLPDNYSTYLVQISNTSKSIFQITDLVVLVDNNFNVFNLERASLNNSTIKIADLDGYVDDFDNISLRFDPIDPYNDDYDIKVIQSHFPTTETGIGSTSVGFVRLFTNNQIVSSGVTTNIVSVANTSSYKSFYGNIQIIDNVTNDMDFVEIYVVTSGNDTYMSQYYFDTKSVLNNYSSNFIGSFGSTNSSGVLSLTFNNDISNPVTVKSKIVGFGSTAIGVGTFRFKLDGQIDGLERTAKFESNNSLVSTASTILSLSKTDFSCFKSKIQVSIGNTSALHQVLVLCDGVDSFITQYPYISLGSNSDSGIGTFGVEYDPTNIIVKFYPDSVFTGRSIDVRSFSEIFYTEADYNNIPNAIPIGRIEEVFSITPYNGLNARRINKLDFDLNYKGVPIFKKTFNPSNTTQLNPETGVFTIQNHYFNTGEELIYTPASTFLGIGATAVGIGTTLSYTGVVTDRLPPRVYPIKIDNSNFRLATTKQYALAGIYVTFTSYGQGNAHELEMTKKLEKSLITIDTVVQSPIAYSLLDYSLKYNTDGFGIGAGNTLFSISGISSIKPNDILKIENEFVKVTSVGLGTTSGAVITGVGTFNIVGVTRGFAGTAATTHKNDLLINLYRGSYNISGNKIYFSESPRGNAISERDRSNLEQPRSSFTGRVYLRKDYTTNVLYDNISEKFTGIGQTYVLTVQGANTTGIGSTGGNGIVFINSIFQTPSTENNIGNNFKVVDNSVVGITSLVFSGITSENGQLITSQFDVNQNQLPRGGIIVSLGSTYGLGYAPLVGVGSTSIEIKLSGGSISSIGFTTSFIVGVAVTGLVGVTTNVITGILTNSISIGQEIQAVGVITSNTRVTAIGFGTIYINNNSQNVVGIATTFRFRSEPTFGSGYFGKVSIGISDSAGTGAEIYGRVGSGGSISGFEIVNGGSGYVNPYAMVSPPSYENLPVIGVSRIGIGSTTSTGVGLLMNVVVGPSTKDLTPISGRNADAANLILANTQLIAEVSIGRMLAAYPSFTIPTGNQSCIDDIIAVLECIAYNLRYGGNNRVYDAAKLYVDNDYLAGEEAQSIYAFVQARDLAIQVMRNIGITTGGYSSLAQVFDYTIEGDISGVPGVYQTGCGSTDFSASCDCSDVASAIASFVGIVTFAIATDTVPTTRTGGDSPLFEVESFKITRPGYGFQVGDVFKPVGLVTAKGLSSPTQEFKLTVLDTFTDSFSAWQFGEMDYIDSIKSLQDGSRTRFPLYYNGQLLSFEKNANDQDSLDIDLGPILLIFVNGIVQEYGVGYNFEGGSSFTFQYPPLPEDNIAIFFYRGTRESDSLLVNINETIKRGDILQVFKNPNVLGVTTTQNPRTITDITASDTVDTNIYIDEGVDTFNYKPFSWTKQKIDQRLNGEIIYKSRDSLESGVYPTARIIKNLGTTDSEIFVDDAYFFKYEQNQTSSYVSPYLPITISQFGGLIVGVGTDPVSAAVTAVVSAAGTISSLSIVSAGYGYTGSSVTVKIARPKTIGIGTVGIGSTAAATISVTNGRLTTPISITRSGAGYTRSNPPQVIVPLPKIPTEKITGASVVSGFSGIITGITTSVGIGTSLALRFYLNVQSPNYFPSGFTTGYPLYIYDTVVGRGVTSINTNDNDRVGIGTTFVDNIYIAHSFSYTSIGATNAEIVCNILSTTSVTSIGSTGLNKFAGRFSWGKISGFSRSSNPISIDVSNYTISGLTTYPTIQRRNYGLRDNGALKKDLG